MDKKALFVVTSNDRLGNSGKTGWYLSEVSHVYWPLKEAGFKIDFASTKGGDAPMEENSLKLDDPLNKRFVEEMNIKNSINTRDIYEFNPLEYEVIYFAGGHGTMWDFPNQDDIARAVRLIYERGGIVAAVCHGPSAFVGLKLDNGRYLVEGKEVNSFTNGEEKEVHKDDIVPFLLESKLREQGAIFLGGKNWENKVVVCERLITGQNPQSALSLGKAIVEKYNELHLVDDEGTYIGPELL